jgi:hypothetical protein
MEGDDIGGFRFVNISFMEEWAPFHSRNGICASRLGCKPKGNKTQFLILDGHLSSYLNIWSMRHWRFMIVG